MKNHHALMEKWTKILKSQLMINKMNLENEYKIIGKCCFTST